MGWQGNRYVLCVPTRYLNYTVGGRNAVWGNARDVKFSITVLSNLSISASGTAILRIHPITILARNRCMGKVQSEASAIREPGYFRGTRLSEFRHCYLCLSYVLSYVTENSESGMHDRLCLPRFDKVTQHRRLASCSRMKASFDLKQLVSRGSPLVLQ